MAKNKVIAIDSSAKWRGDKDIVVAKPKRYSIQGDDSGHRYFVEVGMEGEFERWVASFEENYADLAYDGHDYEENRIDGLFTFTDPRSE